jgi:hypothetical protein
MDAVLADLLKLLHLEQLDDHRFRGQSHDIGAPQVFGGQVLGQGAPLTIVWHILCMPTSCAAVMWRRRLNMLWIGRVMAAALAAVG